MCGIAGIIDLDFHPISGLGKKLAVMSDMLSHRGPDANGYWQHDALFIGLMHRRLSVIDLSGEANQPMCGPESVLTYNGEIYNYKEIREQLSDKWRFQTRSDTEVILAAYKHFGVECLQRFRGMFSFALWDPKNKSLFCARDRFGIKPFYYAQVGKQFYFASEAKALLPFLPTIETETSALSEYLTFQYAIGEKTLFKGIKQLLPGHALTIKNGQLSVFRYWDVNYDIDFDHSPKYFIERLQELMAESISLHLQSDVQIGSYLSGGIDSSLVLGLATDFSEAKLPTFNGKFSGITGYDESHYAQQMAGFVGSPMHCLDITHEDFDKHINDVIYHLDFPVAGPGAFAQYMISKLVAQHVKVVLGGQGGDEIFGGYARYTIAYLEQCLKAAIEGTYHNGNYVVTIESIIPNLQMLKEYKPLIKEFWRDGLFENMDRRYFRLINRANDLQGVIDPELLAGNKVFDNFEKIFNSNANVPKKAYFDKMTHYDFKCFLPSLLQVEDRMSMAHGLESRVPFLDHPLVEFAATVPADVKFKDGIMKYMLKTAFDQKIPKTITNRRDKMGFPVPLKHWFEGPLQNFYQDTLSTMRQQKRDYLTPSFLNALSKGDEFSRKTWGLLSLELWQQNFHDKASYYRNLLNQAEVS